MRFGFRRPEKAVAQSAGEEEVKKLFARTGPLAKFANERLTMLFCGQVGLNLQKGRCLGVLESAAKGFNIKKISWMGRDMPDLEHKKFF